MRAALLVLLTAAAPARGRQGAPPAQAPIREAVAQALPPDVASRAGRGDLAQFLSRLPADQRAAALQALSDKDSDLSGDPAVLAQLSGAYLALGSPERAGDAADRVLAQDPGNADALSVKARVLAGHGDKAGARGLLAQIPRGSPQYALAQTAIQLSRGSTALGSVAGSGAGGAPGGALAQRVQGLLGLRGQSTELSGTLSDAGGVTVRQLKEAGINFAWAPDSQRDAVQLVPDKANGTYTIYIRHDAADSKDARAAAHVGDGIRQAQTERDHPTIGWALVIARGWITGAKIHKELAPGDIETHPGNPSDQNLMIQRKLLDLKSAPYNPRQGQLGTEQESSALSLVGMAISGADIEGLFMRFIQMTGRGQVPH